ncbi:ileal sodium/bile acid cotransporter [Drosophila biarmipes]|uniref:ileal sodium/bile acid cotransporter n=1 Tax=Drosophila biarmipes TaxID=125945 RepID=UPI0007E7D548|nr:ileal sodium/bile acid cotransporter [Drosophila biarmipes]
MSPLRCSWVLLLLLGCSPSHGWMAHFRPAELKLHMEREDRVQLTLENLAPSTLQQPERFQFRVESADTDLASIPAENATIPLAAFSPETRDWTGTIVVSAHFLGQTKFQVRLYDSQANTSELPTNWSNDSTLNVKILRPTRVLDLVFVHTVILLMTLLYINFGAALDLEVLRGLIVRPIGPCICFVTQVVGMPLLSYALGVFIFPNAPVMQLGLFFTGISPSGGASNTWAAVLDGNIHLSVLLTTVCNVAAFATMPMWLFTLGQLVFDRVGAQVPYQKIAVYCSGLILPLLVGLLVQRRLPRIARVLVRLLKPISTCLILFIIVFAIITNYYLFYLFSWQIVLAGIALPGLGYIFAWLAAKLLHQNAADALTIAIETGIQNTGIAIFLLTTTLESPESDLTTVVPVAVAVMTPFPLLGIYLYKRFCAPKTNEASASESERIV